MLLSLLVWLASACVEDRRPSCADGLRCPTDKVCDTHGGCAWPEQLDACANAPNGQVCMYRNEPNGLCSDGLCVPANCGNGIVTVNEVCDDGNTQNGDGCSADCLSTEVCGNGRLDPAAGEQCDDGNAIDQDGCQRGCKLPRCGDGIVDAQLNEACDDGAANGEGPDTACRSNCQQRRCGDGVRDSDEVCDDGNVVGGDGCSGDCQSLETCGNGYVDIVAGEACDDGNADNLDGCLNTCSVPTCGDGFVHTGNGEACDAGAANADTPDADCRTNCQPQRCGDGIRDTVEVCDDGNVMSSDGCSGDCKSAEVCGNGYVDATRDEQCDSGVAGLGGDGCSSQCQSEVLAWRDVTEPGLASYDMAIAFDEDRGVAVMYGGQTVFETHDTWEFDSTTWRFRKLATSAGALAGAAMAYDGQRRRMVLFGGVGDLGVVDGTWEFNGVQWTKRQIATPPFARLRHAMVYDSARQRMVLFGGMNAGHNSFGDTWEYDGTDWQVRTLTVQPAPRYYHALAYDETRHVVVLWGGSDGTTFYNDTWEFDGVQWQQRSFAIDAPLPSPREGARMIYDRARQRMVLFGGRNGTTYYRDLWEFDGAQWQLINANVAATAARALFGMVYDSLNARAVFVGGRNGATTFGDTGFFSAGAFAPSGIAGFRGRRESSAVYDSARQRLVIFGGDSGGVFPLQDQWEFNGTSWARVAPASMPSARADHSMVYDEHRRKIVLFGGRELITVSSGPGSINILQWAVNNETWEFDGLTWSKINTAVSPPARAFAHMTYDQQRQRVVLFGGATSTSLPAGPEVSLSDTWEYDGQTWTQRLDVGAPTPRALGMMAYSPQTQRIVLFGGQHNFVNRGDTWQYDGSAWVQMPTTNPSPTVRHGAAFQYEPTLGGILLFGGAGGGYFRDSWLWDGARWRELAVRDLPKTRALQWMAYYPPTRSMIMGGGSDGVQLYSDVFALVFSGLTSAPNVEVCAQANVDDDGDNLAGCADPDCWYRCDPTCAPGTSCAPTRAQCGDGVCDMYNYREDYLICPADCAAP